ncbi:MAG: threonine/serine dehydratase [Pseudomonadota bacterium]
MSDIEAIRTAAKRLHGHAKRTPMLHAPLLDEIAGRQVLVKAECLQLTGSFKYRGARAAVSALSPEQRARGVLAFSSGNHAQGVALVAQQFGIPAVIIMPADAPALKIANTKAYGAEIVLYDRANGASREALGEELRETRGLTLIKPFDDHEVIAGQGTCGLEIADQASALGVKDADVLVCCGGGGFTSGIALALEAEAPGMQVRPVEPEGFDDVKRSLLSGHIETNNQQSGNICDAIITPSPGQITFPILQKLCGPGLVVSEEEALQAMMHCFQRLKLVAEPGGAVALAAALFRAQDLNADTVICTISGGNVDADLFVRALDSATATA